MNFRPNFSAGIQTFVALTRRALPLAVLLLTACSGGTGSGTTSPALSGVAAVGTPIVNGVIKVACATGSGIRGTTDSSGAWSVTLTNQTLPCAVELSGGTINGVANAVAYHAIATSVGTVNLTPITDLVTANLVGNASLSTWFAGLSASPSSLSTITSANVNAAITKLSTALSGLTELSTTNPITVTFTPTSGNPSDDMLTALANAMTSNNTSYSALLSGVATTTITLPAGFNNAVTTAYASTASGSVSISATATTTAQSLTAGTAMTSFIPLAGTGGTKPYTYSYAGTLPAGLSFSASTGAVTGTPTAVYSTANIVFSVQDAKGVVANTTSTVSFTVGDASPTITATANTTAQSLTNGAMMTSFSPLTTSGGAAPYTYSITSGTLPAGLSLNASTGAATGTPTAVYPAANVIFSVKDAYNAVASTTSTVSVAVGAISATANTAAQSLTVGTAMASFSPLTASGGTAPYTYSITSGTLPTGLSFSTSLGTVTGIPALSSAAANVVFSVQDANNVVASTTSSVSFTAGPTGYVYQGGLTWMPISATTYTWSAANTYCTTTTINGTSGWRLPTQLELSALYNAYPNNSSVLTAQGWTLIFTWSSTPYSAGSHYGVHLTFGGVGATYDTDTRYVTC